MGGGAQVRAHVHHPAVSVGGQIAGGGEDHGVFAFVVAPDDLADDVLPLSLEDGQAAPGGVVLVLHPGGGGGLAFTQGPHHAVRHPGVSGDLGDHLRGDGPGAEHRRNVPGHVQHGGLDADLAGPAVQDQGDAAVHVLIDVGGGGRAGAGGKVGAGGGDGQAADPQHLPGDGMAGHPDAHGSKARRHRVRHGGLLGQQQGQRPGPVGGHQAAGGLRHLAEGAELVLAPDVDDQRVVRRAALGLKDPEHGLGVQGVRAQAVDRFRGKGHQLPFLKEPGGQLKGFPVRGKHPGIVIHGCSFSQRRSALSASVCSCAVSASMISSRSPSRTASSLYSVRPARWSVTRLSWKL